MAKWNVLNRFGKLILVAMILVVPLTVLYVQNKTKGLQENLAGPIIDVSSYVERTLVLVVGSIVDEVYRYSMMFSDIDELYRLKMEIRKVHAMKALTREIEIENVKLKQLLNASSHIDAAKPVAARVIGRGGTSTSRIVQIDKGTNHGIRHGDAVIDDTGAVGRVLITGRSSSDVLLITDAASSVDVIVQRSRAQGMARGGHFENRYILKVNDFDRLKDVQIGDTVVTSGIGTEFPVGMLIGKVVKAKPAPDGMYLNAEIEPAVDFAKLEHVLVLRGKGIMRAWQTEEPVEQCLLFSKATNK